MEIKVVDNGKNNIFVESIYKKVYADDCFSLSIHLDGKINWGQRDYSISASSQGYEIRITDDKDNQGPTVHINFNARGYGYRDQINKETIELIFCNIIRKSEIVFLREDVFGTKDSPPPSKSESND